MDKKWDTYGKAEITYRASLRSRPDRDLCVFRIDAIVGQGIAHTVFLDRATTPIAESVYREWIQALDTILLTGITHRYGLQLEVGEVVELLAHNKEGGSNKSTTDN